MGSDGFTISNIDQLRHGSVLEERNRVVALRSDQNILEVDQPNLTRADEKEIVEVVIPVADSFRVRIDRRRQFVQPARDGGRRRHPQPVPKKPEFKARKLPAETLAVERRVPAGQVRRCQSGDRYKGPDQVKGEVQLRLGRGGEKSPLRVVFAKVLENCPPRFQIVIDESGHTEALRGTPGPHLQVTSQLTTLIPRVPREDRREPSSIPKAGVPPRGRIASEIPLTDPESGRS